MEHPILFSTPMVRAILEGKKSMTRRVVMPQPTQSYPLGFVIDSTDKNRIGSFGWGSDELGGNIEYIKCPYGKPGDILWVRETWGNYSVDNPESSAVYYLYRADYPPDAKGYWYEPEHINFCDFPKWRPSIHMPREACRIRLKITDVRVERLQDITEEDAKAEGIDFCVENGPLEYGLFKTEPYTSTEAFQWLWDSINKSRGYGWDTNPWVWVICFERIQS